jgi:translation initiation factor 4E
MAATLADSKNSEPSDQDNKDVDTGVATITSLTTAPPAQDFNTIHPLERSWTLWYNGGRKGRGANDWSAKKIMTFDTVEDFWRLYNNIAKPSRLSLGSNYHIFKTGVQPEWEDSANKVGGKWVLNLPRRKGAGGVYPAGEMIDEAWQWTLLAMIGEFFGDDANELCGAVLSPRKGSNRLSLWTKNTKPESMVMRIGATFKRSLLTHLELGMDDLELGFQVHAHCLKHGTSFRNKDVYKI